MREEKIVRAQMEEILAKIARRMNAQNLLWGVGASFVLFHHGIGETPGDIDIFVAENSWKPAFDMLSDLASRQGDRPSEIFPSRHFAEFSVEGVEVDLICGFRIRHTEGIYEYFLDEDSMTSERQVCGEAVPICSPEDWLLLYALMPGREKKHLSLLRYLQEKGCDRELLKRAMSQPLPPNLRCKVSEELLQEEYHAVLF